VLGLELHWPRDATEWAAWASIAVALATVALALATFRLSRTTREEIELLREQTAALEGQAETGRPAGGARTTATRKSAARLRVATARLVAAPGAR
jgi:hypothetical protein